MQSASTFIRCRVPVALSLCLALCSPAALAHALNPAVVTVTFSDARNFAIEVRGNTEALLAGIGTQHADTEESANAPVYDRLRGLEPAALEAEFAAFAPQFLTYLSVTADRGTPRLDYQRLDVPPVGDVELARKSLIRLSGRMPREANQLIWRYSDQLGNHVLRLHAAGATEPVAFWLTADSPPVEFALGEPPAPRAALDVATDYLVLGFKHIVPLGLDHIAFVLGLFLLSLRLAPILWQVTAFTLAHTVTLGLTMFGYIALAPTIVEPLIALSIVYVGLENVFTSRLSRRRIALVFGFGLLHGMGFAGVLTEIGLPRDEYVLALVTFNVGVEAGQLSVIAAALVLVGWYRRRANYRRFVVIPASALISLIGAYWAVERMFF